MDDQKTERAEDAEVATMAIIPDLTEGCAGLSYSQGARNNASCGMGGKSWPKWSPPR